MKQKLTTLVLVIALFVGTTAPRVSHALPVIDSSANGLQAGILAGITVLNQSSQLSSISESSGIIKEFGLDSLAYSLSKLAGTKISNKVFNKATGGASGDSSQVSYVQNFAKNFADLQLGQVDKFITDLGVSNNPFAKDIAQTLVRSVQTGGSDLEGFNLDQVIGSNWKDFSRDASVGGYEGLLALSNPANTNIGSALIAKSELANAIETAKEIEKIKLTSPGTKPQGACNLTFGDYKTNVEQQQDVISRATGSNSAGGGSSSGGGHTSNAPTAGHSSSNSSGGGDHSGSSSSSGGGVTPTRGTSSNSAGGGSSSGGHTSNAPVTGHGGNSGSNNSAGGGVTPTRGTSSNSAGGGTSSSSTIGADGKPVDDGGGIGFDVGGLIEDYGGCLDELIKNPVGLVTSTLSKALDSVAESASQGDEIGEILVGMLMNMATSFLKGGLTALNAEFQQSRDDVGGPEQLVARNGQRIAWTATPNVIVDMPAEFQSALDSTASEITLLNNYVSLLTEQRNGQESFADATIRLDMCLPGPDFMYEKRMTPYINKELRTLTKKQEKGSDKTKEDRADTKAIVDPSIELAKSEMVIWRTNPQRNIPGAGIMSEQIAQINQIKTKYQKTRSDIIEKQSTLNLLYKIESDLKINMQLLKPVIPTLPATIPFTNQGWTRMTAAEKTQLFNWAKTISKQNSTATDDVSKRDFAISVVWSVWSNPDAYITTTDWDGADFLKKKNIIRTDYSSLKNAVSIPYSIKQAELAIRQLQVAIETTKKLATDCETMKTLIRANRFTGPTAHTQLLQVLKANKERFQSDAIKQSLDATSILSTTAGKYPENVNCDNGAAGPWQWSGSHADRACRQDAGIEDQDAQNGGKLSFASDNEYQTQPARDIWETLEQDDAQQLFCTFNQYLGDFITHATNVEKGRILCQQRDAFTGVIINSDSPWYRIKKIDLIGYLYNNDFSVQGI